MDLNDKDKAFLTDQIRLGNVVLFLGAGANHGATNARGNPIKSSAELEGLLRTKTHVSDSDVSLGDLVEEYRTNTGDSGLNSLLQEEFADCTPSEDQKALLAYAWYRIYTLNIDDAIEKVPRRGRAQQIRQVNRSDAVDERRSFDYLEIIHLNGYVGNKEAGFVFTPAQYRSEKIIYLVC
jgi:hypothetical protein